MIHAKEAPVTSEAPPAIRDRLHQGQPVEGSMDDGTDEAFHDAGDDTDLHDQLGRTLYRGSALQRLARSRGQDD